MTTEQSTKPTISIRHFKLLLLKQIEDIDVIDMDEVKETEGLVVMDFPGYPNIKLSVLENLYHTFNGLELSILLTEEDNDEVTGFLYDLESQVLSIAMILRAFIFSQYSELTNNDACSFKLSWDTNHAASPGDDSVWSLKIEITDYLS